MLSRFTLLLLLLLSFSSYAQNDTIFLKGTAPDYIYACDRKDAKFYRLAAQPDGEKYLVNYYTLNHKLYVSARSKYKDTILFDGYYIEYDSNGKKHEYGNLILGRRVGQWKLKYPDIDKTWAATTYWVGNKDTAYEKLTFYRSGKLKRKEYRVGDSAIGVCYNETGEVRPFTPFNILPEANYDPNLFVARNIQYPIVATNMGMQGRILVRFTVDKTGKIGDVLALNDAETLLAKEAVGVVKKMPPWKPAMQDDVPIAFYATLPVNFKIW